MQAHYNKYNAIQLKTETALKVFIHYLQYQSKFA